MGDAVGPPRHSLSTRLLCLTICIVLAVEVLIFVPEIAHERVAWLQDRAADAYTAALVAAARGDQALPPATVAQLLQVAGSDWIRLDRPGLPPVILAGPQPVAAAEAVVLGESGFVSNVVHALRVLAIDRGDTIRVVDDRLGPTGTRIQFVTERRQETKALRRYARDYVWVSLITACLTGAMIYVAVSLLLVRPMRRIIASIVAFRTAPERPLEPRAPDAFAKDELAETERELAAMQAELRDALWRNARLAALGSAVARISHDLRGILAPALLAAEQLQTHQDAAARRAGAVLMRTVDRATDLVGRTLDFAREGPPPLQLAPVPLALLVDEVAEAVRVPGHSFAVANQVPPTLLVEADRNQFFRVLANLLRNAADAGARAVRVSAETAGNVATIDIADDGPGLPDAVRPSLFRPFARSTRHEGVGLGLAIARDLMLAHGGEIALASSGPEGTVFRLTLRAVRPENAANDKGGDGTQHTPRSAGIAPAAGADV